MQWLLEKGAEVDAKDKVRGDPTEHGDPEGVGKGRWGPHPFAAMQLFLSKPWPLGGSLQGGSSGLDFGGK